VEHWQTAMDSAEHWVCEYTKTRNPEIREKIIKRYSGMVERIARKYAGLEPIEDLVQVGKMGLLNALGLYEPTKGVRFNTYATHLVAGAIKHHLRDKTKLIREPAWLQEVRHKVNRVAAQMQQELGRPIDEYEVAQRCNLTVDLIREVWSTEELFKVSSLAVPTNNDVESETDEIDFADEDQESRNFEDRAVLEQAMSKLRDLERKVLQYFHFDAMSQTEIAERLEISPNYVSHILRQSLAKLRNILVKEERSDRLLTQQEESMPEGVWNDVAEQYSEAYLFGRLNEECQRASCNNSEVAFIRVAFEGLQQLGNFYGPEAVESFLRDAGAFLKDSLRRLDIVGCIGQNGFGVILPGAGQHVQAVHQRLTTRLKEWMRKSNVAMAGVQVFIGAAYYPYNGRSAKKLLQEATLVKIEVERAA
jgi:RNA polymerase sigma-B factor